MSRDLRAELIGLLGAVGHNRSTVEQRAQLVDGLVELARRAALPAPAPAPPAPSQAVHYVSLRAIQAMLDNVCPHHLGASVHLHIETGRVGIVPSTAPGTHAVIGCIVRVDPPTMVFMGEPVAVSGAPRDVLAQAPGALVTGLDARSLPIGSQVRASSQGGEPLLWERTGPACWARRIGDGLGPDWTAECADDLPVEIVRVGPAKLPESPTHMSHGGEVVLPPELAPIEINHESLRALILALRPTDEGTCVWREDDGTVSLFAGGGQLVGRVVLGADGPEVRFTTRAKAV